jgi:hypothetical protein
LVALNSKIIEYQKTKNTTNATFLNWSIVFPKPLINVCETKKANTCKPTEKTKPYHLV